MRRRSIVEEANSLGAAVTAAVGTGLAEFPVARELSEATTTFTPSPDRHAAYRRLEPWFEEVKR